MNTRWGGIYPDVVSLGGLGAAMREEARLRGCDLGAIPLAPDVVRVETKRGIVWVDPSVEERLFRVGVHIPGFDWEIGSTDDLGLVVEAVAAWRAGVALDELKARFEFMEVDEFVRVIESGEPVVAQWSDLLTSDFYRGQWNLLRCVHADEVLREFFPTISHGALRLRIDPLDWASRQVLVRELDGGRYEVICVGVPGAAWVDVPAEDLIACLRVALKGDALR
ncbi:hypothetical protein ACIBM4_27475 [Streptomyces sp. NPDC050256]|uniref:hypothetical protein n=1 Tax=unclassified Streptomyces TaxID=2593676 RepID=UPI003789A547